MTNHAGFSVVWRERYRRIWVVVGAVFEGKVVAVAVVFVWRG